MRLLRDLFTGPFGRRFCAVDVFLYFFIWLRMDFVSWLLRLWRWVEHERLVSHFANFRCTGGGSVVFTLLCMPTDSA